MSRRPRHARRAAQVGRGTKVAGEVKVGENRCRVTRPHDDNFVTGDVHEHRPGRTIAKTGDTWFTLLRMDTHLVHFDEEHARHQRIGPLHRLRSLYRGAPGRDERRGSTDKLVHALFAADRQGAASPLRPSGILGAGRTPMRERQRRSSGNAGPSP